MSRSQTGLRAPIAGRLAVILGLWIVVALVYWPSSEALDGLWRGAAGETYTHGYVVLIVCLWLIVRDRARLAELPIAPAPKASIAVLLLSLLWLWAWSSAIQTLHVVLLPLLLLGAVVVGLGWRTARRLLFPVCFLYFAMPVWVIVNGPLQALSARVNGLLIWLSGLSAFMQGTLIQLPGGTIDIESACSGLHAFIVGLALAALYGEIRGDSLRRRALWLGIMGALALIDNWVRIFVVTVAAYETDMRSSLVVHHYWLGWYLFTASFIGFLWLAERLGGAWDRAGGRAGDDARDRVPSPGGPPQPADAARVRAAPSLAGLPGIAVALVCIALLPALAYARDAARSEGHAAVLIDWPSASGEWSGAQRVLSSEWDPHYVHASAESLRRYVDPRGRAVEIFAVAYRTQTQRAKLLDYENALLGDGGRLRPVANRVVSSPAGRWRETLAADAAGARSLIWSRYRIGDRTFVRGRLSQLWYGWVGLVSSPLSSLTALRTVCAPSCGVARARLAAAVGLAPAVKLDAQRSERPSP